MLISITFKSEDKYITKLRKTFINFEKYIFQKLLKTGAHRYRLFYLAPGEHPTRLLCSFAIQYFSVLQCSVSN